ncbi:MAG: TetR/AcrR family transcriptional regulator [Candidatus Hodarchaeales archaeon]
MTESASTKEKILSFARDQIQNQSYNAFSYAQIAKHFNIKKASVHYYFPSKSDLGVAILQEYREYINKLITNLDKRTADPWEKLQAYFKYFTHILKDGDKICTECILSAEYNTLPEKMQDELRGLFDDHHTWLANILNEGRKRDIFNFNGPPKSKAILIKASMQGGITIARAFGKPEFLDMTLKQLTELLGISA